MSNKTPNTFFISPPLAKYAGFYQELLRDIGNYRQLGDRLIHLVDQAHTFRQFDIVSELGKILSSFPIKQYQSIGHYYLAVACNSCGKGDLDKAKSMFELVADNASDRYRAKALLSLAAVSSHAGDTESQFRFLLESAKVSCDLSTRVKSLLGVAVYKSVEGYHKQSLKDLENLYPLARLSQPIVFFDYLNSLAVELSKAGRNYEARNIIRPVIASPFSSFYPEWQETAQELKEPNRSFLSVSHSLPDIERRHVELETKPAPTSKKDRKPADVLPFKQLKEAPEPDKPERVNHIDLDDMTDSEKLDFIMTALRTGAIRPTHYNDIIYQAGMPKTGPASKVVDLEDETVMTDKLIEWAHMIDPEDLAGVISALRDCDDKLRQVNLMDAMIRKLFEYSAACGVSEDAWRKKVERRLPKQ